MIDEGALRFTFAAGCQACKFDGTPWYRQQMKSQVKAMDLVVRSGDAHWWIEIKDCATYEAANLPRLDPREPADLAPIRSYVEAQGWKDLAKVSRRKLFVVDEVAEKLEGTIVGLLAAGRAPAADAEADEVRSFAASDPAHHWTVVLLLSWNIPDYNRLAIRLKTKLDARLKPYNVACWVVNETQAIPGQPWAVTRLPPAAAAAGG